MTVRFAPFLLAGLLPACSGAGEGTPSTETNPAESELRHELITQYRPRVEQGNDYTAASLDVIEDPEHVRLFSLVSSEYRDFGYGRAPGEEKWRGVLAQLCSGKGVRGSIALEDRDELAEIVGRVYRGLVQHGPVAFCYEPRHALVFGRGESEVVALICFECHYWSLCKSRRPETVVRGSRRSRTRMGNWRSCSTAD